ncbi:hypothetical protein CKO44_07610 [Rubrivivax gelatinosus]|uniref:phage portal protein family protein n=1 Tax=Rubrivivax gelatinosus TaxID=28068 RepID=UPI001904F8E6|nr:DUF935 family protein [Rubrivivax gelatinosus]MBK1613335.1 hypothetical protein [Rubrivivax gelatinosus]
MNINFGGLVRNLKAWFGRALATPETDPWGFFGKLHAMPNPDPILRSMGMAEKVYLSILADPHVIGEVRSIRGNFRAYNWRIKVGDSNDPKSVAARELCARWMRETPPGGVDGQGLQIDWQEVMWQMTASIFTGYRAHEVVWDLVDGAVLPIKVLDRPNRRFLFDANGAPLLVSTSAPMGAPIEQPSQFVISRHMPDATNPYGVALLSSCFWAWTFKSGGWRYFVKYCERHGLPWPFGRYPIGTSDPEQDKMADALANMMEAGYVLAPEGSTLELLTPGSTGGTLPQQALIDLANVEMSKALTGQSLVAELHGVGSRAASETASQRQASINDSDRDIAVSGMGAIFKWITLYNFGPGVAPPELEFFTENHGSLARAQTYSVAAKLGARPSRKAMLDELGMPAAEDDADALQAPVGGNSLAAEFSAHRFARDVGLVGDDLQLAAEAAAAADAAIEDHMIAPVAAMLARHEAEGRTLAEFAAALSDVVGEMDDEALRQVIAQALTVSILKGAATDAD